MADLVIGHDLFLVIGQHRGLTLLAGDDDLHRLLEVVLGCTLATLANGAQAPSLMILARSAPEAPGVARAIAVRSIGGSVFTLLA